MSSNVEKDQDLIENNYKIMLEFLKVNPRILSRRFDGSFNQKDKDEKWLELTQKLNASDPKNRRDAEGCRKEWKDWKNRIYTRVKRYGKRVLSPLETDLYEFVWGKTENASATASSASSTPRNPSQVVPVEFESPMSPGSIPSDSDENITSDCDELLVEDQILSIRNIEISPKGAQQDQSIRTQANLDGDAICKIAYELSKLRQSDEEKVKVLKKMLEEQKKIQSTLEKCQMC